jgi:D-alanine-D-alanine ligase
VAVNMVHGVFGEDGQLQEQLERHGIRYTGEGPEGSRLAFDKILAKRRFVEAGVPTPAYEVIRSGERPRLALPLVLKPPRQGSSVGVEIVREEGALGEALARVALHGDEILVEEYIAGRELTVGILGAAVLPVIQIVPRSGFYDFVNKYPWLDSSGGSEHLCPAPITGGETALVQGAAMAAHRALGLEVYSRVDVLLDEGGRPFVLEINTLPGMTEASLLPDAAARAGIGFDDLCRRIIEISLGRWEDP